MARKATTRKNHGTVAIRFDSYRNKKDQPEWRGVLKLGADEFDVSLWVKGTYGETPLPVRMTGEVTLKPRK